MARTLKTCDTMSDFNEYVLNEDLSYDKFYLKSQIKSSDEYIIANSTSLLNKYFYVLSSATTTKTFTDKEMIYYMYQPKLFCYDTYGTVELWALLLKLNHMTTVMDFNRKTIKVPQYAKTIQMLNQILTMEDYNIAKNKKEINL